MEFSNSASHQVMVNHFSFPYSVLPQCRSIYSSVRGFDAYLKDHLRVEVLRHRQKSININGIGTPVKLIVRWWTVAGSSSFPSQSIAQCNELLFEAPFSHFYFCRSHASLFMVLPPTSDQPSLRALTL